MAINKNDNIHSCAQALSAAYDEAFLPPKRIKIRSTLTVDVETFRRLEKVVRLAFDNKITLSNYVDNILNEHLDYYDSELKERVARKTYKL